VEGPVGPWDVVLSLLLVAVAIVVSRWQRMRVEASILWASARAAVQLLAVGLLLRLIFESAGAWLWSSLWVVAMVVISAETVRHRAPVIPGIRLVAFVAIGAAGAVALGLVFLPDVIEPEPVMLVVVAGITIGNTMPGTVLAVRQLQQYVVDHRSELEGLLALGFDVAGASRFMIAQTARTALIPQIERTKVVGLIALPGAMTGLLLAGVDPLDAVMVQMVVMYVILGSVATSVAVVTVVGARRCFTPDARLSDWARGPAPG
jgi:putative ABC transport system permease protein